MAAVVSAVQSEAILRELAALWRTLGKQDDEKKSAVLRACAMTLIVVSEDPKDESHVNETLASLMHEHPSRAIVLRLEHEGERLEATVRAQCWMPFGSRQQICCEQIEITASSSQWDDLPTALFGLTVPDLPVVIFCRQARLLQLPELNSLWPLAHKVITDLADLPDASKALAGLQEFRSKVPTVGDLAWTRLTRWREAIAHLFDSPQEAARLPEINCVQIGHRGPDVPVEARYLAAWFHRTLGAKVTVRLEASAESQESIQYVRLSCPQQTLDVSLQRDGAALEVRSSTLKEVAPFLQVTEYLLLREELSILGRDALFDTLLAEAARG